MAKRKVFDSFDSTPTGPTVAQTLREAREAMGHELRDVATMLRIRYPYLQAIEGGQYQDLPGAAYAAGFLRSYAEYLGLDPVDIVARYKAEAVGALREQELYLPTPATEERVPGGTLLLVTLVLAGLVYGGWYYLSATDRSMADLVPRLPDRLVSLLDALPMKSGAPPSAPDAATPAAPIIAALPTSAAPTPSALSAPLVVSPSASAPAPAAPSAPAASTPAASTAASSTAAPAVATPIVLPPLPTTKPTPAPVVAAVPPTDEEDSESSPQEPTPLAAQAAAAQAAAQAAAAQAAAAARPADPTPANPNAKVYGMQNQNPKLVLKATQESWLQIRDGSDIVFTRVLKPGDTYRVPDKAGVRIRTGNAGGLVVVADGAESPPLGSVGMVLRDVPIDAHGVVKNR